VSRLVTYPNRAREAERVYRYILAYIEDYGIPTCPREIRDALSCLENSDYHKIRVIVAAFPDMHPPIYRTQSSIWIAIKGSRDCKNPVGSS
jgi:hypothetical protein